MSEKKQAAPPAAAPAKSGGKLKLIAIVVGALVLVGGGGAGAYYFGVMNSAPKKAKAQKGKAGKGAAKEAEERTDEGHEAAEEEEEPSDEAAGIVVLDPFVANLADKDAQRFVRTTVRLVVGEKKKVKELEEDEIGKARLRSTILETLATQTAESLTSSEGKDALKKTLKAQTSKVLKTKVIDVLFTDFLVQF